MLSGCSVDAQWMLRGCSADAQWMLSGCSVHALWMLSGCSVDAPWMRIPQSRATEKCVGHAPEASHQERKRKTPGPQGQKAQGQKPRPQGQKAKALRGKRQKAKNLQGRPQWQKSGSDETPLAIGVEIAVSPLFTSSVCRGMQSAILAHGCTQRSKRFLCYV